MLAAGPLALVNTHMTRIESTQDGKYSLVVNGSVVLYTSSKTIALYYLAQASSHTSSGAYTIPISPTQTIR